ncbi:MAG: PQQ-binding-like beta-propeller repeat protein, partial [Elusimicrobiota bacterium]|nr:PQQ-binding-like beta-propeller repeat protein [Elusimicrobiota bacterium]
MERYIAYNSNCNWGGALIRSWKWFKLLTILLLTTYSLYAASWRTFRCNALRTGELHEQASPYATLPSEGPKRWSFEVQGAILSSPIVKDGIVYFGARDTSIWALDAYTGEVLWQYSTSGWVNSTPCIYNNFVYAISQDGFVYCFKARYAEDEDPAVVWKYYTGTKSYSSPVVKDNKVIFVTGPTLTGIPEGYLYILDATTGNLLAKHKLSQFGYSSPAITQQDGSIKIYFCTSDGNIHCYNESGSLWTLPTQCSMFLTAVAIQEDVLYGYAGDISRKIYAIDTKTGSLKWTSAELSNVATDATSIAIGNNKLIVNVYPYGSNWNGEKYSSFTGRIYCLELTDGTTIWQKDYFPEIRPAHSYGFTSAPAIVNDIVYIGTTEGKLYALNIESGTVIAEYNFGNDPIVASPTISNGWIYFGTLNGKFYGICAEKIVSISQPDNDDLAVSSITVKGTIKNPTSPTNYVLEYGTSSTGSLWYQLGSSSGEITDGNLGNYDISNLADGIYALRLTVNNDPSSRAINIFSVNNPPQPPTKLIAFDTPFDAGGSITLNWTKSADDGSGDNDVIGYKIFRSSFSQNPSVGFSQISTVSAGIESFEDKDLPNEITFYYCIKSFDALTESVNFSNVASGIAYADGIEVSPNKEKTIQLTLADGITVEIIIEKGSVSETVYVGVRISQQHFDEGIPASAKKTKYVYEFSAKKSDGTKLEKFLKSVIIKIPYFDIAGMNEDNLRIYWWDEKNPTPQWRIVNTSQVRKDEKRVWAQVTHFTLFRIMEYLSRIEELISSENVYTYPNPALGDKLYFKFKLGDKADVTVDVYNVAGELIAHLERKDNPAGIASGLEWDISNIASG